MHGLQTLTVMGLALFNHAFWVFDKDKDEELNDEELRHFVVCLLTQCTSILQGANLSDWFSGTRKRFSGRCKQVGVFSVHSTTI